jgi:hypothetical protein
MILFVLQLKTGKAGETVRDINIELIDIGQSNQLLLLCNVTGIHLDLLDNKHGNADSLFASFMLF